MRSHTGQSHLDKAFLTLIDSSEVNHAA
jgi:hypothetical protein